MPIKGSAGAKLSDIEKMFKFGFLLSFAAIFLAFGSACRKRPGAEKPPLPPLLAEADVRFEQGDYAAACRGYEQQDALDGERETAVILRHGLACLLDSLDSSRNQASAVRLLEQATREIPPGNPMGGEVQALLRLAREIQELQQLYRHRSIRLREVTEELEKLKEIDLRRRRAP